MSRFTFSAFPVAALVLAGVLVPTLPAAAADEFSCSNESATGILSYHNVTLPSTFTPVAYTAKHKKKSYCTVAYLTAAAEVPVTLTTSLDGKALYSTVKATRKGKKLTTAKAYTVKGRSFYGVKTVTYTESTSTSTVKGKRRDVRKTSYRNVDGSSGKRSQVNRELSASLYKQKVTIVLTSAKGKRTKIVVNEKVRFASGKVVSTGKSTSNAKKYRGVFTVTLVKKKSQNLIVSNGRASRGVGKAVYNRVYTLEKKLFGAERNGYAGGL